MSKIFKARTEGAICSMGKKKKTDPENIATLEWLRIKFQNTINNNLS